MFKDQSHREIIAQTLAHLPVNSVFSFINSQLSSSKEIIMYKGDINQLLQHSVPSIILERGIHGRYRVWHIAEVLTKYILTRLNDRYEYMT